MTHTLLSLGDSYTIGEGLPLYDNFPYQAVQLLRKAGHPFAAPEIIARTGWTTDELATGIAGTHLLPGYDFVSLLIGVNNQYRGRPVQEYGQQFEELLRQAIQFAGGQVGRVFVISIPDWGVSPFAATHLPDVADRDKTHKAIDTFNSLAEKITGIYGVSYIDITPFSRSSTDFASDGLHPSGQQYRYWAERLTEKIAAMLAN